MRSQRVPANIFEHGIVRPVFRVAFRGVEAALKLTGLYGRGMRNALALALVHHEFHLAGLPRAFDGYTILHMSDLHADGPVDLEEPVARALEGVDADLCVLTGDYRYHLSGTLAEAAAPMARILRHVRARDGIVGIMGNHDLATMIGPLRDAGIDMIVNDHRTLRREGDEFVLIGLDDVHAYQPADEAADQLAKMPEGFRILLVHSPELLDEAAEAGVSLYLTGHTHGGQICLPGGGPLLTNIRTARRFARGRWQHRDMQGYTTSGVGVSIMPVRFNCLPEAALLTLRRG